MAQIISENAKKRRPQRPGAVATMFGAPIDAANSLAGLAGFGSNYPFLGSQHIQNAITHALPGKDFLASEPDDLVITDAAKGLGRGAVDQATYWLGLQPNTFPDLSGVNKLFSETVEQKKAREAQEANEAEAASQAEMQGVLEALQSQEALLGGLYPQASSAQTMEIPVGQSPMEEALPGIEALVNKAFPEEVTNDEPEWMTFLEGLAGGLAGAGDVGTGQAILAAALGGAGALDERKDKKTKQEQANAKTKLDATLTTAKLKDALHEREAPKFHKVDKTMYIEMTEGEGANKKRILRPFTGATFNRANSFAALGGKPGDEVNVLGAEVELDQHDPLSGEQLILARLQQANSLNSFMNADGEVEELFGNVMQSETMNEIISETQAEMMGSSQADIADEITRRRVAVLAGMLAGNPVLREKAIRALNLAYGNDEKQGVVLPNEVD